MPPPITVHPIFHKLKDEYFTLVFREIESIIYKGDAQFFTNTRQCDIPIFFYIPPPRCMYKGISDHSLQIVMSIRSAHIIFYNIMYCSKISKKLKKKWIHEILERDKYFSRYQEISVFLYIDQILECKMNRIYNVHLL